MFLVTLVLVLWAPGTLAPSVVSNAKAKYKRLYLQSSFAKHEYYMATSKFLLNHPQMVSVTGPNGHLLILSGAPLYGSDLYFRRE